jgi:peptidoglycan LD-endopeptidase LytH
MKAIRTRPSGTWLLVAASCGFLAGLSVMAALFAVFPEEFRLALARVDRIAGGASRTTPVDARPTPVEVRPTPLEEPPPVTAPPVSPTATMPSIGANPLEDLRRRRLELPVEGAARDDIRDSFDELRGGGSRRHEAIDILAARNTPVIAVEDGTIARLFYSDAGGVTVYQFDPTTTYVYYYAHLERYADGLAEGASVMRGQRLGYVGTSGNAPRDTPHLHFAIFRMTDEKRWWQGTPIDPFLVLR